MASETKKTKTAAKPSAKTQAKTQSGAKKASAKTVKTPAAETAAEVFISKDDMYLFGQGTHYDIYKKLGAHPSVKDGRKGYYFAVWAPNALSVHVIGSWNGWNENEGEMEKLGPVGIWGLFIEGVQAGQMYKFLIYTEDGSKLYKADPYANQAEFRPGTASVTADLSSFKWDDGKWESERDKKDWYKEPMAIYECHIGSFMKHPNGTEDGFYNYREFAARIIEYLKEMKYTHIELMGIAEHPFDGSWGYQVTGYYAPTSRYGSPQDFMYLINELHKAGVGVILDWVPAHFATDAHGLGRFDGECIYEDPDPRRGEHPDWGTKIFNLAKPEVKNFLIANVLYWLREYHVDGIRVDAVASMLYLDYGKKDGQWLPNKYGDNKNLDAIVFFQHMNSVVRGTYPGFITIAEESTAWPNVTGPIGTESLGFTFKWNMGWMHDFCEYMKLDPVMKKGAHNMMTFAMTYNESEHYILPLSHDEVVHLKCSMVEKMPGYKVDKYANLRTGYTYMFGHSGKKLLFMGQDFGQEREWSEARELDWFLLGEKNNAGMKEYMKALLEVYRKYPCLYRVDDSWKGFEWMNADDSDRSIYSFVRRDETGKKNLLFILNMTPMKWEKYVVPVPVSGEYKLVLNSDEERFGGWGSKAPEKIKSEKQDCVSQKNTITLDMNPFSALVYVF
ncbi:MAG: 1,4-alpha-glucan branching protein GlgB [Lachnospiraceae bacterium]|nr:1,4-alpha-glucan branching protein GlgB [Lachnospiraceae bacterium]